jgi:ATP-dependent Clp protease ATP-binding subunit ClpX
MTNDVGHNRFSATFYPKDLYQLSVKRTVNPDANLKPSDIKARLDQYIIGQEEAKKALATAVVNHYIITKYNKEKHDTHLKKTSLMLVGSTGTGKTYMLEVLGRVLRKHVVVIDITHYTQAGYVGKSVESILYEAQTVSKGDLDNTIIFIDEIDKVSESLNNSEVSGRAVQMELLKLIEGGENVTKTNSKTDRVEEIDTRGIMWVLGGAFTDHRESKADEVSKESSGGFGFAETGDKKAKESVRLTHDDMIEVGLMRELIGRISDIINLEDLSEADLIRILKESKDSPITQYKILADLRGVTLSVKDKDLKEIAKEAIDLGTGARALKTICDRKFKDLFYT